MPLHLPHTKSATFSYPSLVKSKRSCRTLTLHSTSSEQTCSPVPQSPKYPRSSPFDLLPLELQIEIFSHCLPLFPHLSDIDEVPLLISRVCKSWKTLVLSTPKLWSSFEVEVTGSGPRAPVSAHDVDTAKNMNLWLKLSKGYPLAARIVHIPVGRAPDLRSAQLLGALIPEARRWRHIELILPAVNISALQQSLSHDFPLLQSLTLQLKGAASSDSPFDLSRLNIPWHQLTALNLQLEYDNLITLDKCLDILSQTRTLVRCSFDAFCDLDRSGAYANGISLPALEELHLNLHGNTRVVASTIHRPGARLTKFINLLTMPKLDSFGVGWLVKEAGAWSQAHPDFLAFLHRVSETLQTLSIEYLPLSERDLLQCLAQVPNVIRLDLRFSLSDIDRDPITDALFMECTSPSTLSDTSKYCKGSTKSKSIIPLLEHLNIECHGKGHTSVGLTELIESRWSSRSHRVRPGTYGILKSFRLLSMNQPLVFLDSRVKKWRDEGLDISIDSLVVR